VDTIALCSRAPDNELIAAESEILTGCRPEPDGLVICKTIDNISRAAYLSTGLHLIAHAGTLEALAAEVKRISFSVDKFRIICINLSTQRHVHRRNAILVIADAIQGLPDLDHPQRRFLIIIRDNGLYLGEIQVEPTRSYLKHDTKPYRTSSSLPSQLARALVNLAYPARTIFDPCCGTGSILLEACALDLTATGMDRNPKMVGMSRQNLLSFGYQAVVRLGDARQCTNPVEAIVTDLPYGLFLELDEANVRSILHQMASQAPLGIYVAGQDISTWLQEAGYRQIEVYRVRKRPGMTRYVHRALGIESGPERLEESTATGQPGMQE
jgi:tRNA G10  N-methylase Trm11